MKENIHPEYRDVVFYDVSCGFKILTRSTIDTKGETTDFEGQTYPAAKIEISSESHPFFTGQHKIVDTAGRVEKFRNKYAKMVGKTAAGAA